MKSFRIKNLGIFLFHILGKRYLSINLDPILGCNLRCQMCYFSDEEKRKTMHGAFRKDDLPLLANAFFHRALKLQIGCGAEPSLYKYNSDIIQLAKQKKVSYISYTTNGNLLEKEDLLQLFSAGLDEITVSMHGVYRETYEKLMVNASYDRFHLLLKEITELKTEFPKLKLRINYTINKDNLDELTDFFSIYGEYAIDIIQLRPIYKIGNSVYQDFSIDNLIHNYDNTLAHVIKNCRLRNIICLAPQFKDLINDNNTDSIIVESTYCYISPRIAWEVDFDFRNETFEQYTRRTGYATKLFKKIFIRKNKLILTKRNLNYSVS